MKQNFVLHYLVQGIYIAKHLQKELSLAEKTGKAYRTIQFLKLLAKIDVSELKAIEAQTGSQRLMQECVAIRKLCIEALTDCEKGAFVKAHEAISAIIGLENTLRIEVAKRTKAFDVLLGSLDELVLFRGVNQPNIHGRIGRWWSTDPFYALQYSGGGKGFFAVAKVLRRDIEKLAKDASIEAGSKIFSLAQETHQLLVK